MIRHDPWQSSQEYRGPQICDFRFNLFSNKIFDAPTGDHRHMLPPPPKDPSWDGFVAINIKVGRPSTMYIWFKNIEQNRMDTIVMRFLFLFCPFHSFHIYTYFTIASWGTEPPEVEAPEVATRREVASLASATLGWSQNPKLTRPWNGWFFFFGGGNDD